MEAWDVLGVHLGHRFAELRRRVTPSGAQRAGEIDGVHSGLLQQCSCGLLGEETARGRRIIRGCQLRVRDQMLTGLSWGPGCGLDAGLSGGPVTGVDTWLGSGLGLGYVIAHGVNLPSEADIRVG
ncbi:hypothetical protein GCM10009672_25750 [Nesterenkonia lutea]